MEEGNDADADLNSLSDEGEPSHFAIFAEKIAAVENATTPVTEIEIKIAQGLAEFMGKNEPSLEACHVASAVFAGIENNFDGLEWGNEVSVPESWRTRIKEASGDGLCSALLLASALKAGEVTEEDADLPWHEGLAVLLRRKHPLAEEFMEMSRDTFSASSSRKRPRAENIAEHLRGKAPAHAGMLMQRLLRDDQYALGKICAFGLPLNQIKPLTQYCPQLYEALPQLLQEIYEKRGCTPEEWEQITGEKPDPDRLLFLFTFAATILIELPVPQNADTWAQPVEAAHALVNLASDKSLEGVPVNELVTRLRERYTGMY